MDSSYHIMTDTLRAQLDSLLRKMGYISCRGLGEYESKGLLLAVQDIEDQAMKDYSNALMKDPQFIKNSKLEILAISDEFNIKPKMILIRNKIREKGAKAHLYEVTEKSLGRGIDLYQAKTVV